MVPITTAAREAQGAVSGEERALEPSSFASMLTKEPSVRSSYVCGEDTLQVLRGPLPVLNW